MAETNSRRRYMVNGNLAMNPEYWQEPARETRQDEKKKKKLHTAASLDMLPFLYVGVVAMACICILVCSSIYIHTKTNITGYSKQVASLQSELEQLKKKNVDLQDEIATSTDVNAIRERAEELGMKEAGKGQIIYYDQSESEYVRQKEDIPNDKK